MTDHAGLVAEVQRRLDTFKYPSFDRGIVEQLLAIIAALSRAPEAQELIKARREIAYLKGAVVKAQVRADIVKARIGGETRPTKCRWRLMDETGDDPYLDYCQACGRAFPQGHPANQVPCPAEKAYRAARPKAGGGQ